MVDCADAIANFLQGVDQERFGQDDLLRSAVLLKLILIGEAAARLPQAFKQAHADVPWQRIAAFRNFAVHEYFAVQWSIVYDTARSNVPPLRLRVVSLLEALDPGPS